MPFFLSSRLAYHCGYKTTAMLCSSGAKDNWQCKLTAVIRLQPCSVAVAPKLSHLSHQCTLTAVIRRQPCSVAMAPAMAPASHALVLAALAEYEFGITGSFSTRVQAAQRSVRPAHYKVQSPLSSSVWILSSIDELCGRMSHARAYDF